MWDRLRDAIENPILVKHVRSRLRKQPLFSSIAVLVMLNLCLAYAGYELDWYRNGGVAGAIVALQVVLLSVMGAAQVNGSVSGARASGILDFHRVSPLTPTELTLGFFFGAPIREYALFASTLPFAVLCMAFGVPSFRGFVQLLIVVLTSSWLIHGVMVLNGLMSKAKNPTGGAVGVIVFVVFFFAWLVAGATYSVNLVEGERRMDFFGISLPWLPVVLLYQLPVLFFLLLAATRKMESQRLHPLSNPQAIVAMATFATLILGGIWRQEDYQYYQVASLYMLTVPAILLTMMVTPSQAEYAKGLHRAKKQGKMRLPWWDDLSVNGLSLAILAGIVLAAGTLAATAAAGANSQWLTSRDKGTYSLALAAAVLTVAYFGLALQYFQLRFARRGVMYFGVFLFTFWVLPLLAGSIQSMASGPGASQEVGYPIFALSPVAGIGMIFTMGDPLLAYSVQAACLTPVLLFTFVFNYLVVGARRRVMQAVFAAPAEKPSGETEPEFASTAVPSLVVLIASAWLLSAGAARAGEPAPGEIGRRLYVAEPGIRNYLEYGGHGLLVYDIDHGHRLMRRIPTAGLDAQGKPINVKGICASARTRRIYISTIKQLMCLDLVSEKLLWEKTYEKGCDRMAITPDGSTIVVPSFEGPFWYFVRAEDGEEIARVEPRSGSHNTIVGPDGKRAYLAGLNSPDLTIVDARTHRIVGSCGPFAASIRPFTINGAQTLCFVNVNRLLGFEVGDLTTGQKLYRVEVAGYSQGPTKRHGCPSHGIGLTPDGRELWLTDAHNRRMHIFDATVMPPKQVGEVALRDEPGWITFGIDGRLAYPSTGDVVDVRTRKVIAGLKDEEGREVQSEKLLEVDFRGGLPVQAGDQFGFGRP